MTQIISTLKLALIGAGAWSGAVGDVIMKSKKVQLVTCFDVNPEKRLVLSHKFGCNGRKHPMKMYLKEMISRRSI